MTIKQQHKPNTLALRPAPRLMAIALAALALGVFGLAVLLMTGCETSDQEQSSDATVAANDTTSASADVAVALADTEGTDAESRPVDGVVIGTFLVRLVAPSGTNTGYTSVLGKVYDAPTPETIIGEESIREGSCWLVEPRVPFCEIPCVGEACVEDDVCRAYPGSVDVGTVTMDGLEAETGETSFTMDPLGNTYQPIGVSFPINRSSRSATSIPLGNVELVLISTVEAEVLVPGLVSCSTDEDCPEADAPNDSSVGAGGGFYCFALEP